MRAILLLLVLSLGCSGWGSWGEDFLRNRTRAQAKDICAQTSDTKTRPTCIDYFADALFEDDELEWNIEQAIGDCRRKGYKAPSQRQWRCVLSRGLEL